MYIQTFTQHHMESAWNGLGHWPLLSLTKCFTSLGVPAPSQHRWALLNTGQAGYKLTSSVRTAQTGLQYESNIGYIVILEWIIMSFLLNYCTIQLYGGLSFFLNTRQRRFISGAVGSVHSLHFQFILSTTNQGLLSAER